MRLRENISVFALLLLGIAFAAGNVGFAAMRSTIPTELHGNVTRKQRLLEKHPGVDDVCMITLGDHRPIQVDRSVFDLVKVSQSVDKRAWAKIMEVDGKETTLEWSADFYGMLWAMPLTMAVCVVVGMGALRGARAIADGSCA